MKDNRCYRVAALTHRSMEKRKKQTLDRAWIGPMVAPRREEEEEEERHTHQSLREKEE
jgi:hypothetical protein